jgi:hypothetical protein
MHLTRHVIGAPLLALLLLAAAPSPARADITAFLGTVRRPDPAIGLTPSTTHTMKSVTGASFGMGLIIVGFEVEGAMTPEDTVNKVAGLKTGMANVMVQTPTSGVQLYATTGAGLYHETLGTDGNTNLATNIGGGLKLSIAGPVRLRLDYRVIHMNGRVDTTTSNVQRFYAGINLKF